MFVCLFVFYVYGLIHEYSLGKHLLYPSAGEVGQGVECCRRKKSTRWEKIKPLKGFQPFSRVRYAYASFFLISVIWELLGSTKLISFVLSYSYFPLISKLICPPSKSNLPIAQNRPPSKLSCPQKMGTTIIKNTQFSQLLQSWPIPKGKSHSSILRIANTSVLSWFVNV